MTEEEKKEFEEKCIFLIEQIVLKLGRHGTKAQAEKEALRRWQSEKVKGDTVLSMIAERVYREFVLADKKEYAKLKKGFFPHGAKKKRISMLEVCINEETYVCSLPAPKECHRNPPHCLISEDDTPIAYYFFDDMQLISSVPLPQTHLDTLYSAILRSTYELVLEYNRRAMKYLKRSLS